jgi:hypothetical protein
VTHCKSFQQGEGLTLLKELGTFVVNVRLIDIKHGMSCSTHHCPIALAVQRFVNTGFGTGRFYVTVGDNKVTLSWGEPSPKPWSASYHETKKMTYTLSSKDRQFVNSFDKGRPVNPKKVTLIFSEYARMVEELNNGEDHTVI